MGLFNRTPPPPPPVTQLGPRTSLEGEVSSRNPVEVHGSVKGSVSSDARVLVTSSGKVEGDLSSADLECAGSLAGRVTLKGTARFSATARWQGEMRAAALKVEKGASIEGRLASCQTTR